VIGKRPDPTAPSGLVGRDGSMIPNALLPRGLGRLYRNPRFIRLVSKHFNRVYYYGLEDRIYGRKWLGEPVLKYPTDMWVYQEILADVRPEFVLETGTHRGGSALFFATVLEALGGGSVLSVDYAHHDGRPEHPRLTYLTGSTTDPEVIERIRAQAADSDPVLVILDSDHTREHVLGELRAYADLVSPGSYLIVEDSNINGHPVLPGWGPGPHEAIEEFLAERSDFVRDRAREELLLTSAPGGFLKRIA
jgi:cephalosporin hydroxylase